MTAKVFVLVTWDVQYMNQRDGWVREAMPTVRSYEDEHDAIEALKDARPIAAAASLYACDETGQSTRVEGW